MSAASTFVPSSPASPSPEGTEVALLLLLHERTNAPIVAAPTNRPQLSKKEDEVRGRAITREHDTP